MNATSPFSLFDTLSPGKLPGMIAGAVAERTAGQNGLAGAFSDLWHGLDADGNGQIGAMDAVGHAVGLRNAVLQGIADVFDTQGTTAGARPNGTGITVDSPDAVGRGFAPATDSSGPIVQTILAAAPPALPSAPASRAVENLPGIDQIRATYAALRATR